MVCGVTENISGLVFQSCGADTGVLGMNVRGVLSLKYYAYHCINTHSKITNIVCMTHTYIAEYYETLTPNA